MAWEPIEILRGGISYYFDKFFLITNIYGPNRLRLGWISYYLNVTVNGR